MFTTFSTQAGNGKRVIAKVTVLEYATRKPWRVEVAVDGSNMAHAHFSNRADADKYAESMHNAYLKVHANERVKKNAPVYDAPAVEQAR